MDLEGIVLREINQSEKDKTVRLHSHVEYKTKQKQTKQNKNKLIDTDNRREEGEMYDAKGKADFWW